MDQVLAVREVYESYITNEKDVFWALMDLENLIRSIGTSCSRC